MPQSESAKQAAVAWIREQMDRHALSLEDLVAAGCFASSPSAAASVPPDASDTTEAPQVTGSKPLYRNALGQSWDGTGEYPDWLQRAVNAGQSIEFFRVD